MPKNTSIILGDHFDEFINGELNSGRYKSASEVIRSGLRLLEEEKRRIEMINEALVIGENSGKPKAFNSDQLKKNMRKKLSKRG